ncbi:MAG: YqgE/AlgH family protein [Candidatus Polarisedimenticolia bacterium]
MGRASGRLGDPLAPGFVAAMPQLGDPNFRRAVVLLLRHSEEGAFGLVVNRRGPMSMDELCRREGFEYNGPPEGTLMIGGPVQVDGSLVVLHGEKVDEDEPRGDLRVAPGIYVVTDRARFAALAQSGARRLRCFAGYSGWGPGQIERELEEGAWAALPADPAFIFDVDPDDAWRSALHAAGIDPATLTPGVGLN